MDVENNNIVRGLEYRQQSVNDMFDQCDSDHRNPEDGSIVDTAKEIKLEKQSPIAGSSSEGQETWIVRPPILCITSDEELEEDEAQAMDHDCIADAGKDLAQDTMGICDDEATTDDSEEEPFIKIYSKKSKNYIVGSECDSRNRQTAKISFQYSIPEDETMIWRSSEEGQSDKKTRILSIIGGRAEISVSQIYGDSGVLVNLYQLYERCPSMKPDILLESTVGRDWQPEDTILVKRFFIEKRAKDLCLQKGQGFVMISDHHPIEVSTEDFLTRHLIPTYLIVISGMIAESCIKLKMTNKIKYKCINNPPDKMEEDVRTIDLINAVSQDPKFWEEFSDD